MVLFNCGVVCFVGASLGLGTCYNPLIHASMAICRPGLILTTCELGVTCAMALCFVAIVVIFHLVWAVYRMCIGVVPVTEYWVRLRRYGVLVAMRPTQ